MHLWETGAPNVFAESHSKIQQFQIQGWQAFLDQRKKTNDAYHGILLWHHWSTPSNYCDDCTEDQYCDDHYCEDYAQPDPADNNEFWVCFAMQPGYVQIPFIYIITVDRSDEPLILEWLDRKYKKRGLTMNKAT